MIFGRQYISEASTQAKAKRRIPISLRLVAAFLLVALMPTLAATWLAISSVSKTFDANLDGWLAEASTLALSLLEQSHLDDQSALGTLAQQTALIDRMLLTRGERATTASDTVVTDETRATLALLGYDVIALRDANGAVVFANSEFTLPAKFRMYDDWPLSQLQWHGQRVLMLSASKVIYVHGAPFQLLMGNIFDTDFFTESKQFQSLDFRLYFAGHTSQQKTPLADNTAAILTSFYSSLDNSAPGQAISPDIETQLKAGRSEILQGAPRSNRRAIYRPIRSASGELIGALYCSLKVNQREHQFFSTYELFFYALALAALVAIAAAIAMARWLSRPLETLSVGARAIAGGDFAQTLHYPGDDEYGDLMQTLNQMARQLAASQQLEQKFRQREHLAALGEVALSLTHEVRNPLGIIKTSAELLKRRLSGGEQEQELLGFVVSEVQRIDGLLREFMATSRPKSADLVTFKPAVLIGQILAFCAPRLRAQNIQASCIDCAGDNALFGDPETLYQALLNLLVNSMDATPDGGSIEAQVLLSEGAFAIIISDTGIGIDASASARIFDVFYTTKTHGTGLGLARVRAVMESHKGHVSYSAKVPKGAQFRLDFPASATRLGA